MALVKPSGAISDIRGKVGGSVFFRTGAGLAIRNSTTPVNPNTPKQNNQRIIINTLQQEWRNLTECQRKNWRLWAKLFPIKQNNFSNLTINAQQTFIRTNVPFLLYGHTIISDPVFTPSILSPITFNIALFGAQLRLQHTRLLVPANEFIELLCTYPQTCTINNPGSKYKSIIFATTNAAFQTIKTPYEAVFGRIPVVGEKIFYTVGIIDLLSGHKIYFRNYSFVCV